MPTDNQTLIAIPLDISDPDDLRLFLSKLVVALDLIVGYRGDASPFVTQDQLDSALVEPTALEPLESYEQVISPIYVQIEMQAMSDAVTALTNKVNEIIKE